MNLATISQFVKGLRFLGSPPPFFFYPMQDLALPSERGGHCVKELLK